MNKFDSKKHKYTMDGFTVPSVTQVLPPVEFYCTPEQLEAARVEGVELHRSMSLYFAARMKTTFGDPDIEAIDKLIRENSKHLGEPIFSEESLFSKTHKFGGTPDVIFTKSIVDFKRTLSDKRRLALQLGGYKILAKENKIIKDTKKFYIIHRVDNNWKLVNVYHELAESIFIACVKRWHLEQSINNYFK